MTASKTQRSGGNDPRFRDTLRRLPPRVWIASAGILVNRAGNFLPVFIVLYLIQQGYSPGSAGLVLGAAGLGNVLGNTFGGYLADQIGRRWTIVLSGVITAGLTACIPLVHDLPMLVGLVGLVGTASQLYRPASAALLVDGMTPPQRLAAAAIFRFAMNIGAAIGGVLGGLLATTSYTWLFIGNAAAALLMSVIAAILLRDVPPEERAVGHEDVPEPAEVEEKAGYRRAFADRRLRRFLLMTLVAEFVYIQSTVGLPLHVTSVGLSPTSFGLLIGFNGLLVLLFELPITSAVSQRRPEYVLAVGNVLTGVGLALTVFANDMFWLSATVVLWTLGEMMYASMAAAHLGGLAPANLVGRYQGLYGAAITLGTGIGPLIGGVVYSLNTGVFWTVVGIAGLWSAQLCLPQRRPPVPPAAPPADSDKVGSSPAPLGGETGKGGLEPDETPHPSPS